MKNYFEIPKALIIKSVATNPYIALGLGSGWQTWSRPQIDSTVVSLSLFNSASMSARQKISANVIWMVDTGFRIRSAFPDPCLEVLLGCKYNQWGQARSVGKTSQQGRSKVVSFVQPFSIKVVYQFAPYVGVQCNF